MWWSFIGFTFFFNPGLMLAMSIESLEVGIAIFFVEGTSADCSSNIVYQSVLNKYGDGYSTGI
jgi:hypothetical protein